MTKKRLFLSPKAKQTAFPVIQNKGDIVAGAIKWVSSQKISVAHVTTSAESAATCVILNCVVTPVE